jgi:hypothetical protein
MNVNNSNPWKKFKRGKQIVDIKKPNSRGLDLVSKKRKKKKETSKKPKL